MNRRAVIDQVITGWRGKLAPEQEKAVREALSTLRADRLLAVSAAPSVDGLLSVLKSAETTSAAAGAKVQLKDLGTSTWPTRRSRPAGSSTRARLRAGSQPGDPDVRRLQRHHVRGAGWRRDQLRHSSRRKGSRDHDDAVTPATLGFIKLWPANVTEPTLRPSTTTGDDQHRDWSDRAGRWATANQFNARALQRSTWSSTSSAISTQSMPSGRPGDRPDGACRATGATGPAGADGATGPMGPTGPIGPLDCRVRKATPVPRVRPVHQAPPERWLRTPDGAEWHDCAGRRAGCEWRLLHRYDHQHDLRRRWPGLAGGSVAVGPAGATGATGAAGVDGATGRPGLQERRVRPALLASMEHGSDRRLDRRAPRARRVRKAFRGFKDRRARRASRGRRAMQPTGRRARRDRPVHGSHRCRRSMTGVGASRDGHRRLRGPGDRLHRVLRQHRRVGREDVTLPAATANAGRIFVVKRVSAAVRETAAR